MKYKINYTDGNVLNGELDGVATDIKVLGNLSDKFIVQVGDKVGTMKVDYTSCPNTFIVEALELPADEDDGSGSDDSGSDADGSGADTGGSSPDAPL